MWVTRPLVAVVFVAAVAGLAAVLEPNAYPSYDYAFVLASAQDVLEGRANGYDVLRYSPVPNPLTLLVALAIVPLGEAAFAVFAVLGLAALGLLCWALLRIGTLLGSWPAGLLAAALGSTSPPLVAVATSNAGESQPHMGLTSASTTGAEQRSSAASAAPHSLRLCTTTAGAC